MIAHIIEDGCTNCSQCVDVCPTFVLDPGAGAPVIARIDACQTCYMCEIYCPEDAIYVAPDQFAREAPTLAEARAHLGRIRRDHGWDRPDQPGHLDAYRKLGPLLGEGVDIATRRYDALFGADAAAVAPPASGR